jgi:CheY-like chemotaxis protein
MRTHVGFGCSKTIADRGSVIFETRPIMETHPLVALARIEPVAVAAVFVGAFVLFLLSMKPPSMSAPPKRRSIVLIDDDPLVRRGLRHIIEERTEIGVVGEAGNGTEGVTVVEMHRPDLVLVDVRMPVMDGIEATRRIKELDPDIRVIGFSSTEDDPTGAIMRRAGASSCLVKGDSPDTIAEELNALA